jgi:ubiquinone/menaquinone biosynthesis C-methylase UbiE
LDSDEKSMTTAAPDIVAHYGRGGLLARLKAALAADGADPERPTIDSLAPYDQFHSRGIEANHAMVGLMEAGPTDHLLDIGSGVGGPARVIATRFGCRVTGIDLTPEFCEVACALTQSVGLQDQVAFELGDALRMPFADATFDGAYSMNVSMNIADKEGFYREIRRVLKPGGWLVLSELTRGDGPELDYPTSWAASAESSFLATAESTRRSLLRAGFEIDRMRSTLEEALEFGRRSRAMVERGEKPPHRAVMLIHGELATAAMANVARGLAAASIVPVEVLARKLA